MLVWIISISITLTGLVMTLLCFDCIKISIKLRVSFWIYESVMCFSLSITMFPHSRRQVVRNHLHCWGSLSPQWFRRHRWLPPKSFPSKSTYFCFFLPSLPAWEYTGQLLLTRQTPASDSGIKSQNFGQLNQGIKNWNYSKCSFWAFSSHHFTQIYQLLPICVYTCICTPITSLAVRV